LIYERNNFDYDYNLNGLPTIQFSFTEKVLNEQYPDNHSYVLPSILFGVPYSAALFCEAYSFVDQIN
jgi:hypothetical protein